MARRPSAADRRPALDARLIVRLAVAVVVALSSRSHAAGLPLPAFPLAPPSFESGDAFGAATAGIGTTRIVVGAPARDDGAVDAGAAYVFDATDGSLLLTLANPSPTPGARFGAAVAAVGGDVLVGAPHDTLAGRAYLFDGSSGLLLHAFQSSTPTPGDHFGAAVGAWGGAAAVGAPDAALSSSAGGVFVFDPGSGALDVTLTPPAGADRFGAALAEAGADLLVGAPGSGAATGTAHLFAPGGTLGPSLTGTSAGSRFGAAVAGLSTGDLAVGAPATIAASLHVGAVHVFAPSGAPHYTIPRPSFTPPAEGDAFGAVLVSLGTELLVAGPPQAAFWLYDAATGGFHGLVYSPGQDPAGSVAAAGPPGDIVLGVPTRSEAALWDRCGNGFQAPREGCDDGNTVPGDGCAANCGLERCPLAPTPAGLCDQNGVPHRPGVSRLKIRNGPDDATDTLALQHFTYTPIYDDPRVDNTFYFCVYDRTAGVPSLVWDVSLPPGGTCGGKPCWRGKGTPFIHPYGYKDPLRTQRGVFKVKLAKPYMKLKARGVNLLPPSLPLAKDPDVTIEIGSSRGLCWQATFSTATTNAPGSFDARSD